MRHVNSGRKLNRTSAHRLAMRRNLAQSLFEHGEVRTTLPKAKDVRGFAEKLVSLAIDGGLAARRRAIALLNDRAIIAKENQAEYDSLNDAKRHQVLHSRSGRRHRKTTTKPGVKFTAESVINRLFASIGPKMKKRAERLGAGGYTRIIKLADRRIGDGSALAILQLVGEEDQARPKGSSKNDRKRRARVRYDFYAGKPIRKRAPRRESKVAAKKMPAESAPAAD